MSGNEWNRTFSYSSPVTHIPVLQHIQRIQQLLLLALGHRNVLVVGKDHLATVATDVFLDVLGVHQKAVVDPEEVVFGKDVLELLQGTRDHQLLLVPQMDRGVVRVRFATHDLVHMHQLQSIPRFVLCPAAAGKVDLCA